MSEWQPIETAPKDGTEILGFVRYHNDFNPPYCVLMSWGMSGAGGLDGIWIADCGEDVENRNKALTHWMPLPEAPQ